MKQAVGSTFLISFILLFIGIFIVLFATSVSYTKAYKMKNHIVNMIEEHDGNFAETTSEIDIFLGEAGYRVNGSGRCPDGQNEVTSNFRYCVTRIDQTGTNETSSYYYKVTTFMYFEIPIVGSMVEIPVSGETKSFGMFS